MLRHAITLTASGLFLVQCTAPEPGPAAVAPLHRATGRFETLRVQLSRALPLEREGDSFRPVLPERLAALAEGGWRATGPHRVEVTLPSHADGAMAITSGQVTLQMRPAGAQRSAGAVAERSVVYTGAYEQADLLALAEVDRAESFVLLRSARAPRTFAFDLRVSGGSLRQTGEVVEARDAQGRAWLRLVSPYVLDAAGERHSAPFALARGRLTISVPAEAKRFPLLVDPGWVATGAMVSARTFHTLTRLASGKVLAAGGRTGSALATAELFDPTTETWTAAASMVSARYQHTATPLLSGKVLVVGGNPTTIAKRAEIYDPAVNTWSTAPDTTYRRVYHTATLLISGKVLVAGYDDGSDYPPKKAEVFDPGAGTWAFTTGDMNYGYVRAAAARLASGKVLVCGGKTVYLGSPRSSAEIYDPATGQWTVVSSLAHSRYDHTATLLPSGKVVVLGGLDDRAPFPSVSAVNHELYDPATDQWAAVSGNVSISTASSTMMGDGRVMAVRGGSSCVFYDSSTGTFLTCGSLVNTHSGHAAALLADGRVLVSGTATVNAELYDPTTGNACSDPAECFSGICVDGICCESVCDETCKQCTASNPQGAGTCTDVPKGQTDANATVPCTAAGYACDGLGACKKVAGQSCSSAAECIDGFCADGTCCDTACTQTCYACNLAGTEGTCSLVAAGATDQNATVPCTAPSACDGAGACKLTLGGVCGSGAECLSDTCVDGVCCDTTCLGECRACDQTGNEGTCTLFAAGTDPDSECVAGQACDGLGACKKALAQSCTSGTECITGLCADNTCCDTACTQTCYACNLAGSQGTCSDIPYGSPDTAATVTCLLPNTCDGAGACKKAPGQSCSTASECASGFCADNTCCDTACTQTCYACNLQSAPAVPGLCSPIPANLPDNSATVTCDGANRCDGAGSCKPAIAGTCSDGDECASGHCVDGFCCNTDCTATCYACNLAGSEGTCSFLPRSWADSFPAGACSGDQLCDGAGNCRKNVGQSCANDSECASDHCVDDVCCDTACDQTCESCALTGTEGSCTEIAANSDPDSECLGVDAQCGGLCDGQGACDFPGVGTACGTCKACDGAGRCNETPLDDSTCGVIDCDQLDSACLDYLDLTDTRCASFGNCKAPNDPATCTAFTALPCGDGQPADAGPDGATADGAGRDGPTDDDGATADAATDSGATDALTADADGAPAGDGRPPTQLSGGCGCALDGASSAPGASLLLFALLAIRRRKR